MNTNDKWASSDLYDQFMGRWSRLIAVEFVTWLQAQPDQTWLDLGCGTGALTDVLQQHMQPQKIIGIDPSPSFVTTAQNHHGNEFTSFKVGSANHIPIAKNDVDILVSALAFNFFADPRIALSEMKRVVKPGGTIALYVWDYGDKMQFLRYFWETAVSLNPTALEQDEGRRFPICRPAPLHNLFASSGLQHISVTALEIPTLFTSFIDFWQPFLGGVGPAPAYFASLSQSEQRLFEQSLRGSLPIQTDGTISLIARVWAIRGTNSNS